MALVKYIGPYAAVTVPSAGGITCEKGKSIEVTEEEAASLLMAPDSWEAGNEETKEIVPHFPTAISLINGFGGNFDATQVYSSGVIVLEGGYEYLSVKASVGETPSLAPTYWQRLGIVSRTGIQDQVEVKAPESEESNLVLGRGAGAAMEPEPATPESVEPVAAANTGIGVHALHAVTKGFSNTGVGYVAGLGVTTGRGNALFGLGAGAAITTGDGNTCVGLKAGISVTTGDFGIYLGPEAGEGDATPSQLYIQAGSATPLVRGDTQKTELGFLGAAPVKRQKLAAAGSVTAAEIRTALINLGLAE